jgi:hypothetical protein
MIIYFILIILRFQSQNLKSVKNYLFYFIRFDQAKDIGFIYKFFLTANFVNESKTVL